MSAHAFNRYLTEREERDLWRELRRYDTWVARRDLNMFRLLRCTGIRVGTLCGLSVGDAQNTLREHRLIVRPGIAKGRRGYSVHASTKARAAIMQLLALRKARGLPPDPDAPLLCHQKGRGRGLSVRNVQMRLALWRERAGLQVAVTPHWFRHTLAKRMVAASTSTNPLPVVGSALGHRDLNSTLVYTRPDREEVDAAVEAAS